MIEGIVIFRRAFFRRTDNLPGTFASPGPGRARGRVAAALALTLVWLPAVRSLDGLTLELDAIEAADWSTGPLSLRIGAQGAHGFAIDLDARRLQLPAPLAAIKRLHLQCREGRWQGGHIRCDQALLRPYFGARPGTPLMLALDFVYAPGRLHLSGRQLVVAGGTLSLDVNLSTSGGRGRLHGRGLAIPQLAALASWLQPQSPLAEYALSAGRLDLDAEFELPRAGAAAGGHIKARFGIRDFDFSDNPGLHAGEGVGLDLTVQAHSQSGIWQFRGAAHFRKGMLYLDPLLLEATAAPSLTAAGRWQPGHFLEFEQFSYQHPGVLQLSASGRWLDDPGPHLESLRVRLPATDLAPIYQHYLQAYTGAGVLSDLDIEGQLGLTLNWQARADSTLDVQLADLTVGDHSGLFALIGLQGDLRWRSAGPGPPSSLRWSAAQMYRLDVGAGTMQLKLQARDLELLAPLKLALLSGVLEVPRLQARALGLDAMSLEMTANLAAIDLAELGNTLAWVPLSGRLSGSIPALRYSNGRIRVDGAIDLSLFDGSVSITNLSLEDPLGLVPRLGAEIKLRNLSLDQLTRSFSFGAIDGRLEGEIKHLVLDGWQPVSFDAWLRTPPGDTSRHRISQRAVDNLASLGGANAVLSSTFLRFFNDFSYRRLGLSCRLRAGVCEMDGVAPADKGYYIVQGGGFPPRVNVVGYNRRVNWQTLLERLRAINQLDEVVVQ